MSLLNNQQQLIEQTQYLLSDFLNNGQFAEAVEIGKLLADLCSGNKNLLDSTSDFKKPKPPAFGHVVAGHGVFTQRSQQPQRSFSTPPQPPQPPKPTQYVWSDGFAGVTLPTPQDNSTDYWSSNEQ